MSKCITCGQEKISKRSTAISTHFHAHITEIARELNMNRTQVYFEVLLEAITTEAEGGSPYPYIMIERLITSPITGNQVLHDLPEPYRTSACNNKQMMTAIEAAHRYGAERGVVCTEKEWMI